MPLRSGEPSRRKSRSRALTVTEMLVSVSLLSVIILGLFAMFDHTQKIFRTATTQVDVLENGRAAMDLISRDLEQAYACNMTNGMNLYAARIPVPTVLTQQVVQGAMRTNIIQEIFFLNRFQNDWTAIGYKIDRGHTNESANMLFQLGVGTLYRFAMETNRHYVTSNNLVYAFTRAGTNQLQRVADGVIHIKLRAFNRQGVEISYHNRREPNTNVNVHLYNDPLPGMASSRETRYEFLNNELPAYVEIELGLLETETYEQARSQPTPVAARRFLEDRGHKVHVLRHRLAIRNAHS